MQQAVEQGRISSGEAAARLLAFLQQKEAEQRMLSEACSSTPVAASHAEQAGQAEQSGQAAPSWEAQPLGSIWGAEAAGNGANASQHSLWSQPAANGMTWPPWGAPGTTTGPTQPR